jgi:hypothetical protein
MLTQYCGPLLVGLLVREMEIALSPRVING